GLGMNVDLDVGFYATHSSCVPLLTPPEWPTLMAPDPGTTILAPDPSTGVPTSEAFDLAPIPRDATLTRAAFTMFDGGALCLATPAALIEDLSGGAFVPTIGALSLMAPGLAKLAPSDAPVALALSPTTAPVITFGSGEG